MQYPGPDPIDFLNIRALNTAFLGRVRVPGSLRDTADALPSGLAQRLVTLPAREAGRLAAAPFLLFSLRERDDELWQRLLAGDPRLELFPAAGPLDAESTQLLAAALSFAWQLAHRNAFALRLLCGASVHWCEELAARPLVDLLALAGARPELIELRCRRDATLWGKLLDAGVSGRADIRAAAQLTAWQTMLTRPGSIEPVTLAAAACRSRPPRLRVADKPGG